MKIYCQLNVGFAFVLLACFLASCGGGGGSAMQAVLSGPPPPTPTPAPTPTPTPQPTNTPAPGNGTPLTGPTYGPNGAWGPPAVANALQMPVQSGYDGTNQTVAIIMDTYPSSSDLQSYFSYFQIPMTTRSILVEPVDGGPSGNADLLEVTLDTETIASLAPGANVIVYGIPALAFQYFNDAVNQVLSDNVASVVSFSAGGCEYPGVVNDTLLAQAASNGVAVVASAGDQGNDCFNGSGYQVGADYPASDPNVTGIGGTETNIPGFTLSSNQVWNDFTCGGQCAGGGGVSAYFGIPTYQLGVSGSPASSLNRNVPDVSMPAEYDSLYVGGSWEIVEGTSWGAPQYAALTAELYEYCNVRFIPPPAIPYYIFSLNPSGFIDVISGNNQFGGTSPYYSASTGYDDASGIGVPLGISFANTICPNRIPALRTLRGASTPQRGIHTSVLSVMPRVHGLADVGRRPSSSITRVQFILYPSSRAFYDEQRLVTVLRKAGFVIVKTFRNHLVVDASAPSATIERFFSTEIHDMLQDKFGLRYAPVKPAILPDSIARLVAVACLDDVITMRSGPR